VRIDNIIFYIMMGIECLLLIPFTLNYRSLDKSGKWAYYYLVSSVVYAVGAATLARVFGNNLWFSSSMDLAQFVILSVFYYLVIKKPIIKTLIKFLPIPAIALFFIDLFKLEGISAYNSIFATVRTFLLLCYGIAFFWQLLFDEELVKEAVFINTLANFWFNAGLFIYLSCSFMDILTYSVFLKFSIAEATIPALVFISGILESILFYIGLLKAKKQRI